MARCTDRENTAAMTERVGVAELATEPGGRPTRQTGLPVQHKKKG